MIDVDGDDETAIKVVIVGNGAVGKSSMIQRFCRGIFTRNYKKTIGVDFLERCITVGRDDVRLMLWDTAGQEEFDAITKAYYRGAQACVVVFSTTDRRSFDAIESWKRKVDFECPDIPMVLVQNKMDLIEEATVEPQEVNMAAHTLGLRLFRTSVKENLNVDDVFHYLAENYMDRMRASRYSEQFQCTPMSSDNYQYGGVLNGNAFSESHSLGPYYHAHQLPHQQQQQQQHWRVVQQPSYQIYPATAQYPSLAGQASGGNAARHLVSAEQQAALMNYHQQHALRIKLSEHTASSSNINQFSAPHAPKNGITTTTTTSAKDNNNNMGNGSANAINIHRTSKSSGSSDGRLFSSSRARKNRHTVDIQGTNKKKKVISIPTCKI